MRKTIGFIIIPILIAYIIASYTFPVMADIISPIYMFLISGIIYLQSRRIENLRIVWKLLALAMLSWGLTDLLWAYISIATNLDPNEMDLFMYLYLITDILLLINAAIYFVKNLDKWNRLQLLLDATVIMIISFALGSALFFSKIDFSEILLADFVGTVVYLSLDILILIIIVTMVASSRYKKIKIAIKYTTVAYIVYVLADLFYIDSYYSMTYVPNSISDIIFMIAFLLFTLSAVTAASDPVDYYDNSETTPNNFGKSKILWWVLIAPVGLYLMGRLSIGHLTAILFTLVIYQVMSHYVQKLLMTEILYIKEHEIKMALEKTITERTKELLISQKELEKRAITDSLTHLYNRDYFIESLNNRLKDKKPFSVAYLDLDRFKIINDLHGHPMGDLVLIEVSKRFSKQLTTDYDIFRVGGDEFAIIIPGNKAKDLEEISQRIIEIMKVPIAIDVFQFTIDASIGFARYPNDALTVSDLVKNADIAMYHAKANGAMTKHVVFSSDLIEQLERRNHIEILLKNADFKTDFELYYQPQFDSNSLEIIGMEALIRWFHTEEGFISPAEFIPIAEEVGLILAINEFVFAEAMLQIKRWNAFYNKDMVMSVNLSPLTLNSVDFYLNLKDLLEITGVNPGYLEFEITEHSAMNSSNIMEDVFRQIKALGFYISIDDFGTGYSSLSYLKRFNVDTLKIAKELIANIELHEDEMQIVKAIIKMSEALGLKIIAEGVETKEQLDILNDLNCHVIQGYYLAKPMTADALEEQFLKKDSKK
ncbi:MAG: bifunctional diguanylate cyclase/phosphodiesterase [Clostridiales bacterium]|nr:bifunctional diguanylate cyclase/phosphodiesterase [Clostridiales bacterium]